MLLPSALGFSPHPPVSVYGTGTSYTIAAFLAAQIRKLRYFFSLRITSLDCEVIWSLTPTPLAPDSHLRTFLSARVPAFLV